jgi:hypothetical protein
MVLVDSSVWIEAARREGSLEHKVGLEGLLEAAEAMFCVPIKLEVLGGARIQERKRMAAYFDCIPYRTIDETAWQFALECAWRLRDKGHSLPWNDILIGSVSLQLACRVYCKDQHFETMRDVLGVRLYKPGYGGSFQPDR